MSLLQNIPWFNSLLLASSGSSRSSSSFNHHTSIVNRYPTMETLIQTASNLVHSAASHPWTVPLLIVYGTIELSFYIVFHYHLVPRANQRTPPQPFRAFGCHDGKDRFMLMRRILDRLERTCAATGEDMFQATAQYLSNWFRFEPHKAPAVEEAAHADSTSKGIVKPQDRNHPPPPPMRRVSTIMTDSESDSDDHHGSDEDATNWEPIVGMSAKQRWRSTSSNSNDTSEELVLTDGRLDGCEKSNIFKWALHTLRYDDVNDLLSCFFFGKSVDDLVDWERVELKRLFDYLETHFALKCQPGRSQVCSPRLLTLEDVDAWHRPLAVYAGIYAFQWGKAGCLYALGFRHYVSKTGLPYWHRPATNKFADTPNPLLFFHGIAPGGSAIYIPMLLAGVANDGRALFIFENMPVACHPSFEVLTEDETIEGVQEALDKFHPKGDIALMGHSFGSFQLTWMIYSPLRDRIRQFALLDPVSILLSEPDLIMNFEDATPLFKIFLKELWTNFYIRRHFSWYRSELWLDDLPDNVDFFVGLAERDQIVNGPKVRNEVEIFGDEHPAFARQTTVAFWGKALHGDCVYQPSKWKEIRNFFDKTNKQKVC